MSPNNQNHNDDDRFKALDERLKKAQNPRGETPETVAQSLESKSAMGRAFRLGVEMVSGLIVGCILGLLIDRTFDTSPWGIILFFFLGFAAGILNVFRAVRGMGYKVGYRDTDTPPT